MFKHFFSTVIDIFVDLVVLRKNIIPHLTVYLLNYQRGFIKLK